MSHRHLHTVLALGLAWSLAPDDASASSGVPVSDTELAIAGGILGGGLAIGGLVTDGLVIHDIAVGRGVRRGPAVAGTVLWGLSLFVLIPLSVSIIDSGKANAGEATALLAADAFALGSMGLSLYGLTVEPPRSGRPAEVARFMLHPTVIPSAGALALGLGVSFRL